MSETYEQQPLLLDTIKDRLLDLSNNWIRNSAKDSLECHHFSITTLLNHKGREECLRCSFTPKKKRYQKNSIYNIYKKVVS